MSYGITPNDDKCACQNAILPNSIRVLIPDTRTECSIELHTTTTTTNTTVNMCVPPPTLDWTGISLHVPC